MFTGWGLYLKDDWSIRRIIVSVMLSFFVSLVFGIAWSVKTGSISDGFAPAAYIVALETGLIAAITFASVFSH